MSSNDLLDLYIEGNIGFMMFTRQKRCQKWEKVLIHIPVCYEVTATGLRYDNGHLTCNYAKNFIIVSRVKLTRGLGVGPSLGNRGPPRHILDKNCGSRFSTPSHLGLALFHTVINQHSYTASVSSVRVGNDNQKDMISEMPPSAVPITVLFLQIKPCL